MRTDKMSFAKIVGVKCLSLCNLIVSAIIRRLMDLQTQIRKQLKLYSKLNTAEAQTYSDVFINRL